MIRKIISAIVLVGGIVALDILTKAWAFEALTHGFSVTGPAGVPLTLAFNQGIAFGVPIPSAGRWIIIFATLLVLFVLSTMFLTARPRDWNRLLAVQLVGAGAIGNLIDRVRWDRGVVDFIGPIQVGSVQWPIFNIADMAITTGAILLAYSLLRDETVATAKAGGETLEMDRMTT